MFSYFKTDSGHFSFISNSTIVTHQDFLDNFRLWPIYNFQFGTIFEQFVKNFALVYHQESLKMVRIIT